MSLPDYPASFWITASLAVILIGVSKAGFGGGVAAVATPLMALTISVTDAAAILLPILIVADLFSIRYYWKVYDTHSLKVMLPGAVGGIALAGFLFGYFSDHEEVLRVGLGIISLAFVTWHLLRTYVTGAIAQWHPPVWAGVTLGGAAGFTSTLAHAGGPPATMYLLPQQLPRGIFVGTNILFFFLLNLMKLVPYALLGLLQVGNLATILLLAPLTYVGVRLGVYLNNRFTDVWFSRLIYTLLFFTGLELVTGKSVINLFF